MQRFVSTTVSRLIELGSVEEENRDIFEYGLMILTNTVINLTITVALGLMFNVFLETLLMFTAFTILRSVSGGYHAKTNLGCVLASTMGLFATIIALKYIPLAAMIPISAVLTALSIGVVFAYAPVIHPNRLLNEAEILKFRKLSKIVVIALSLLSMLLQILVRIPELGFGISLGVALSCAAIVVVALKERRTRNEKEIHL